MIFGQFTVADIQDLLAKKDRELTIMEASVDGLPKDDELRPQFYLHKRRYMSARKHAAAAVELAKNSVARNTVIPAHVQYVALLKASRWSDCLSELEESAEPEARFGSVFGANTQGDLTDLIAAKDVNIAQVDAAYKEYVSAWSGKEAAAAHQWELEWNALKARYAKAKDAAQVEGLKHMFVTDAYKSVLRSLQAVDSKVSPGDLVDLVGRLNDAGKSFAMPTPQPGKGLDDVALVAADTITKQLDEVARQAKDLTGKAGTEIWTHIKKPVYIATGAVVVGALAYAYFGSKVARGMLPR